MPYDQIGDAPPGPLIKALDRTEFPGDIAPNDGNLFVLFVTRPQIISLRTSESEFCPKTVLG